MNPSATPPDRRLLNEQLVQELTTLRDALVQLSLCLRDWQFEADGKGRQSAQQEANALLNPMRHKAARYDNPGQT